MVKCRQITPYSREQQHQAQIDEFKERICKLEHDIKHQDTRLTNFIQQLEPDFEKLTEFADSLHRKVKKLFSWSWESFHDLQNVEKEAKDKIARIWDKIASVDNQVIRLSSIATIHSTSSRSRNDQSSPSGHAKWADWSHTTQSDD